MKKLFFSTVLIVCATVFLSGCMDKSATQTGTSDTKLNAADKVGETTKVGVISKIGEKFYLQEAGQEPKEVESYSVDLSQYVGQNVTVAGQYSGDTLFIGRVE
jgi:hypothetical protein